MRRSSRMFSRNFLGIRSFSARSAISTGLPTGWAANVMQACNAYFAFLERIACQRKNKAIGSASAVRAAVCEAPRQGGALLPFRRLSRHGCLPRIADSKRQAGEKMILEGGRQIPLWPGAAAMARLPGAGERPTAHSTRARPLPRCQKLSFPPLHLGWRVPANPEPMLIVMEWRNLPAGICDARNLSRRRTWKGSPPAASLVSRGT